MHLPAAKSHSLNAALLLGIVMFLGVIGTASAAGGVDVSAVVTKIGEAVAPIGAIGAAVLLVMVATKIYKWVRRAM